MLVPDNPSKIGTCLAQFVRFTTREMSTRSFIPDKPIIHPRFDENLVSYGDRLLWHQLALQLPGRSRPMLTYVEYAELVCANYSEAVRENVERYLDDFNKAHVAMGFRGKPPIPLSLRLSGQLAVT